MLCFNCTTRHRGMGVTISFVRSCNFDKWTAKELKQMELGGNSNSNKYFEANKLYTNGQHDYSMPLAAKYRHELSKLAEMHVHKKIIIEVKEEVKQPETSANKEIEAIQVDDKPHEIQPSGKLVAIK